MVNETTTTDFTGLNQEASSVVEEAQAEYALGNQYFYSSHGEQDDEEAFKWYERAADKGHEKAQFMVRELTFDIRHGL